MDDDYTKAPLGDSIIKSNLSVASYFLKRFNGFVSLPACRF